VQTQRLSLSSQLELVLSGTKQLLAAHDGYAAQNEAAALRSDAEGLFRPLDYGHWARPNSIPSDGVLVIIKCLLTISSFRSFIGEKKVSLRKLDCRAGLFEGTDCA
jgi:hypothetical protein